MWQVIVEFGSVCDGEGVERGLWASDAHPPISHIAVVGVLQTVAVDGWRDSGATVGRRSTV